MAKSKQSPVIHYFANEAFPRRLWIVKKAPFDWIKERFKYIDGRDLEEFTADDAKAATFGEVEHIGSKEFGILIVIYDKMTVSDCAHEAAHFTLNLYHAIGEDVSTINQEVFAYLLGYATDCIYQVAFNRYKPMQDGSKQIN